MIARARGALALILLGSCSEVTPTVQATSTHGATYQVGPGRPNDDLAAVATQLRPGDVVEVYARAEPYEGGIVFRRSGTPEAKITIRGIRVGGKRPILEGGKTTVEFDADHYVFEGFEVTGGASRCIFHHGHDITIRDGVLRDCPSHGLLGAEQASGSLTLDAVEVFRCGNGERKHPIYMATDQRAHPGAVFRMQRCFVHDGSGGNNVKSRAERNEIYHNWFEGGAYRELELIGPDEEDTRPREDGDIVGNVFLKNAGTSVTRLGTDTLGYGQSHGRYRFVGNTFALANQEGSVVQIFGAIDSLEMHNNVFFRIGRKGVRIIRDDDASGPYAQAGSNNWVQRGSTSVPQTWTGTLFGDDPGLTDPAGFDLRPRPSSPLVGAGARAIGSPEGHLFPSPLAAPLLYPPLRRLDPPARAAPRPNGLETIGAFDPAS